jgi:hypothetical protein
MLGIYQYMKWGRVNLYKIIRFRFKGNNRVIKRNLTLEEAQAHCRRDDTRGDGWFDGYAEQ